MNKQPPPPAPPHQPSTGTSPGPTLVEGQDPTLRLETLAACQTPLLIGVRHHSPALAAVMPALLEAFQPERLLIELPAELDGWLPWLGHADTVAPVALACASQEGLNTGFYPFADFSPELAAVRWAVRHGITVEAFDLPYGDRRADESGETAEDKKETASLLDLLLAREEAPDSEALWDRLVEPRAAGSSAEAVRRAALGVGFAMREDALSRGGVSAEDLRREAYMRQRLRESLARTAVVVGAFHAAALLPSSVSSSAAPRKKAAGGKATAEVVTSLISYSFELFDARSGYPAGIRDPLWQQRVWEAAGTGKPLEEVVAESVVEICRQLRQRGHVAGVPDALEATRLTLDLARLRGLPAPGRRELLEGVESALGQGETLGRGRVLARAMEDVLVGRRRGQLAPGTPRSGLVPHLHGLLTSLRLPGPGKDSAHAVPMRLDPLRSDLDRRREVALQRLKAARVSYAELQDGLAAGDTESLTRVWNVQWTPATEATLELAGLRGVTLEQAAAGTLLAEEARHRQEERLGPAALLGLLETAAECGLPSLTSRYLQEMMVLFPLEAPLPLLVAGIQLLERLARGHVPGLPLPPTADQASTGESGYVLPLEVDVSVLLNAAVASVEGLAGSEDPQDARALLELVQWSTLLERLPQAPGQSRLAWAVEQLRQTGAPLMQGAAASARVFLGRDSGAELGTQLGSWVDAAVDRESWRALSLRLAGALLVASPLLEGDPGLSAGLRERIEALNDKDFLERLPALREGFETLSPAARDRLLLTLGEALEEDAVQARGLEAILEDAPLNLATFAALDAAGRQAVLRLLPEVLTDWQAAGRAEQTLIIAQPQHYPTKPQQPVPTAENASSPASTGPLPPASGPHAVSPRDRWRLILGREREKLDGQGRRVARALEELYGAGHGEGSRRNLGGGAGLDPSFPTVREWSGELEALFGGRVREEVLGRAAEDGRLAAVLELNPEEVTPSVELLEAVLSLKGGLPESQLERLRKLVSRIVEELSRELARRVRPALSGLTLPHPTRRPLGPLDLRRTVGANLHTARRQAGGQLALAPERLIFRTRGRRSVDWHVILVVDVSGSMEPSTLYSAMMAAILSGLPALRVSFLAFSTNVIDLSEKASDPLGLLMEVQVGGGTHIAKALRYARQLMTVPARSLVVLVSDFEEGGSTTELLREARAIVESGARALGLAALDEKAAPRYCRPMAERLVAAGMPVAALTPLELARWIGEQIR